MTVKDRALTALYITAFLLFFFYTASLGLQSR